ncbi:MAG TPA: hypothetical protein VH744_11050 [Terriglobales bacterium]
MDYLSEQHFRATPDPPALLDDRAACQQTLVESTCAVHFIGGASDRALEAIEDSIQHCAGPTVLFQPFGAKLSAAEEDFLEALTAEHYPHRVGPNETELKKFLGDLLTRTRKAARATPACLGLICEPVDFPWAEQFRPEGLSVSYPRFLQEKLSVTDRIRSWRQMVRDSHGLLFYNGRSQETLLERVWRLAEEEQSHAIRRWFLDNPDVEAKRHRRPADPTFPDGLSEFLADVRRKAGES